MQRRVEILEQTAARLISEVSDIQTEVNELLRMKALEQYKTEVLVNTLEKVEQKLINIHSDVSAFKEELRKEMMKNYVSKEQFFPVRSIVYGMTTAILLAVLGAWLGIVIVNADKPQKTEIRYEQAK